MPNGRCRFHGGKSTGPRTEAGRQRARTARRVHGFRSAEIIDLRKAAAATSRRLRTLLGLQTTEARGQKAAPAGDRSTPDLLVLPTGTFCPLSSDFRLPTPAGHGVDRHVLRSALTPDGADSSLLRAAGEGREGVAVRHGAAQVVPISAGHGLHRHESPSSRLHLKSPLSRVSGRGLG
jgi:hypothetical protein